MFKLLDDAAFDFSQPASTPAPTNETKQYGPEWDPGYGTAYQNGGDNVWAPDYGTGQSQGDDNPFEPTDNTPQENGGDNVWTPGGHDDAWFGLL